MNFPEDQNNELSNSDEPRAYKVEDDKNLDENDLKRSFVFGGKDADPNKPGYESEGTEGQNFGKTNVTTSGDDAANPSQNAGYSNDYFKRTEPAEEHPENSNFKPADQQTAPPVEGGSEKMQEGTSDFDGGTQRGEAEQNNPDQNKIGGDHGDQHSNSGADKKPDYNSKNKGEEYSDKL